MTIDTESGLIAELRSRNFNGVIVSKISEQPDQRKRNEDLLDHIMRGDSVRFQAFCSALCGSGQEESVVDCYLRGVSIDVSDGIVPSSSTHLSCQTLKNWKSKNLKKVLA
jgi:hypothetical protein